MPLRESLVGAAVLAGFALLGVGLVAYTHFRTAERIAANERAVVRERLESLLPAGSYDNRVATDRIEVRAPAQLGTGEPLPVYRARKDGRPVAAVLTTVAPDGYNGAIRLLVAIRHDGTLIGVRVVSEQETPGLGDRIESSKTNWLQQFQGRGLGNPGERGWAVRKDGGAFDQLTGATITPRAVVKAIHKALLYFRDHRAALFAARENAQ